MNAFQKTALATVFATLFLIFVGGLVRGAGAGLGCPDWPRCWGCWIPPADVSEIDAERYDISLFNPTKMWIEYINRLVGVTIGLLILATFYFSFSYRKTRPTVFYGSLLALLLVLFQGWLGGMVVRSGLKTGMITLHMIIAMILLCILLYTTFKASSERYSHWMPIKPESRLVWLFRMWFLATLMQIILGSQVREAVEWVARGVVGDDRSQWIAEVGIIDHVHRLFSWAVLGIGLFTVKEVASSLKTGPVRKWSFTLLGLVVAQILFGAGMVYFGFPAAFQVMHLMLAALLVAGQFWLIMVLTEGRKTQTIFRSAQEALACSHP